MVTQRKVFLRALQDFDALLDSCERGVGPESIVILQIYGQFTDNLRTIYGRFTDNLRTIYGQFTDNLRTIYGQFTDNLRTIYGQFTDSQFFKFSSNFILSEFFQIFKKLKI